MIAVFKNIEGYLKTMVHSLAEGAGVSITFEGNRYFCQKNKDGSYVINFARLPEKVTLDLKNALEGFCDHEVAHCLFTDYSALDRLSAYPKEDREIIKDVFNMIEDCRIETKMSRRYVGCKINLEFSNNYSLGQLNRAKLIKGWDLINLAIYFILVEQEPFDNVKRMVNLVKLKCAYLLDDYKACENSHQALDLAIKVYETLYESAEDKSFCKEEDENPDLKSTLVPRSGQKAMQQTIAEVKQKRQGSYLKSDWRENNFSRETVLAFKGQQGCGSKQTYFSHRPYTRDRDVYQQFNIPSPDIKIDMSEITRRARKFRLATTEINRTQDIHNQRRGKIDGRKLYSLSYNDFVFKRTITDSAQEKSVCFCLAVDNSGSMPEEESYFIFRNIFEFLNILDVPFFVFTYTTEVFGKESNIVKIDDRDYTRLESVVFNNIKTFEQNAQSRLPYLGSTRKSFTPMVDAYEYGLSILKTRDEMKRVFINITDGIPETYKKSSLTLTPLVKNVMREMDLLDIKYVNLGYDIARSVVPGFEVINTTHDTFTDLFCKTLEREMLRNER